MSSRFLVLLALSVATSAAFAQQQLPNGSFEAWEQAGAQMEPKGWNSLMSADLCMLCSFGASQRVFRDRQTASGKGTSIRIESTSALGVIVNGSVTTGRVTAPSANPSNGYNRTVKSDPEFSLRFTSRPDSLVFWARYSIIDKSDSALVSFLIHDDVEMTDPPRSGASNRPLAVAQKAFQTDGKWQRVSIPFRYIARSDQRPMYLLATFSSSFRAGKGNPRSILWVDDVELIYNDPNQIIGKQTAFTGRLNLIK
jgi:hypothetical protein